MDALNPLFTAGMYSLGMRAPYDRVLKNIRFFRVVRKLVRGNP